MVRNHERSLSHRFSSVSTMTSKVKFLPLYYFICWNQPEDRDGLWYWYQLYRFIRQCDFTDVIKEEMPSGEVHVRWRDADEEKVAPALGWQWDITLIKIKKTVFEAFQSALDLQFANRYFTYIKVKVSLEFVILSSLNSPQQMWNGAKWLTVPALDINWSPVVCVQAALNPALQQHVISLCSSQSCMIASPTDIKVYIPVWPQDVTLWFLHSNMSLAQWQHTQDVCQFYNPHFSVFVTFPMRHSRSVMNNKCHLIFQTETNHSHIL